MKRKLFAVSLAAILLLAGCGGSAGGNASSPSGESFAPASEAGWDMGGGNFEPETPESQAPASSIYQNAGAKLIRRAELYIQTEQFDQSVEALNQLVTGCGGYFESASVYGGGRRDAYASRRGDYTVRVPAEKYNHFLNSAGDLGYITSKTESSEDVGEQYYDTEARLKTQRTKQDRLLVLLEKAETMEDIITLESALSEVEYQIEQYSSTLNRYDALIGFATFTISLDEVGKVTQEVGETATLGQRMAAGFQASVRGLIQGFQTFLIWLSYNLFPVLFLAAAAVAAVIVGKREMKKRREQEKKSGEE